MPHSFILDPDFITLISIAKMMGQVGCLEAPVEGDSSPGCFPSPPSQRLFLDLYVHLFLFSSFVFTLPVSHFQITNSVA